MGGSAPKSTTVYVGKIAPTLEDAVVKQLLEACGPVKSWKRMTVGTRSFAECYLNDMAGHRPCAQTALVQWLLGACTPVRFL